MSRLNGKRALITGGTSGIGLAAARRFSAEGARVAVTGTRQERLDELASEFPELTPIRADVRDVAEAGSAVDRAAETLGGLDTVFLNAGVARFAPLDEVTESFFDDQFAVNVKGVLFTAQAAARRIGDGGSMVVTTSVNNRMGMDGSLVYGASKAAARALVRTLAGELAPRGIRVNAISPGPIQTPIYHKLGLSDEELNGIAQQLTGKIAMHRFGEPDEIAEAALFLASDEASFITGAELVADGGWTTVMP